MMYYGVKESNFEWEHLHMSHQNLVKAMELAQKCKFYTVADGKTEEEILKAEQMLNVQFSVQCKEFYKKYGYLSFFGNEIFGIDPDDNSGILEGNSVTYAINDRKNFNLPKEWVPIYNFEDGNMAYLDYSSLNSEKEPRIIMAFYNGKQYEVVETLAEDFGTFLLRLVQNQLDLQSST